MKLAELNALAKTAATEEFLKCCHSRRWAEAMTVARPFADMSALCRAADEIWSRMNEADWREAMAGHPRIGEKNLREKWATQEQNEQKGVEGASEAILRELVEGNRQYEARFGHIFLVCATGKSAQEMLEILKKRLTGHPAAELKAAADEQAKITRIRLEKGWTA